MCVRALVLTRAGLCLQSRLALSGFEGDSSSFYSFLLKILAGINVLYVSAGVSFPHTGYLNVFFFASCLHVFFKAIFYIIHTLEFK